MAARSQDYYRHHDQRIINNRVEEYKTFMWDEEGELENHTSLEEPHRMAKHHPFDCGTPGCHTCHPHKLEKRRFKLNDAELDEILEAHDLTI